MKRIKLKAVSPHDRRVVHQRRSRASHRIEVQDSVLGSKAQHPSRTRPIHRQNSDMEAINDRPMVGEEVKR
jgi:hypothetical protein